MPAPSSAPSSPGGQPPEARAGWLFGERRPRWPWLALAVLVKVALASYLLTWAQASRDAATGIYVEGTDTASHLAAADQWLRSGEYLANPADSASGVRRVPGYGLTYLLFRLFLNTTWSKSALVVVQVLLSGMSVVALAEVAGLGLDRPRLFSLVWLAYATSTFVSVFDIFLLPESLGVSASIFSVHALLRYLQSRRGAWLLACSVWFTYATSLRSWLSLMSVPLVLALLWTSRDRGAVGQVRRLLAFGLLPIALATAWELRAWSLVGHLVPLETNYWFGYDFALGPTNSRYPTLKDVQFHAYRWIRAVGGDVIYYRPGTLGAWLHEESLYHGQASGALPAHAATASCGEADLQAARARFNRFLGLGPLQATAEGRTMGEEIIRIFDGCRDAYRRERPFEFWLGSPLRLLRSFVMHSGTAYLPLPVWPMLRATPLALGLKLVSGSVYCVTMVLALPGLVVLLRQGGAGALVVASLAAGLTLVFPFVLGIVEVRFLCTAYPWLLVTAMTAGLRFTEMGAG